MYISSELHSVLNIHDSRTVAFFSYGKSDYVKCDKLNVPLLST